MNPVDAIKRGKMLKFIDQIEIDGGESSLIRSFFIYSVDDQIRLRREEVVYPSERDYLTDGPNATSYEVFLGMEDLIEYMNSNHLNLCDFKVAKGMKFNF
ncbi:hypothetical protein [Caballeronia sp. LZ043]|uniref:hypothetical protein n=1 Tax=Caballeronia sp. LZ043 TaxID=3038569 RepID=UPI002858A7C4|nr:hypothetical protein [Caballeronia sp. LZ043]MDR5825946.1 hypothetical protein [Caballeronia sp. LZ043]